jgi:hypothetical protein
MSEKLVAVKKVVDVLYAHCALCTFSVCVEFFKIILLVLCLYSILGTYLSTVILTKHIAYWQVNYAVNIYMNLLFTSFRYDLILS